MVPGHRESAPTQTAGHQPPPLLVFDSTVLDATKTITTVGGDFGQSRLYYVIDNVALQLLESLFTTGTEQAPDVFLYRVPLTQ